MPGYNEHLMSSSVLIFGCCMTKARYLMVKYGNAESSPLSPLQFDSITVSTWDIVIVGFPSYHAHFVYFLSCYLWEGEEFQSIFPFSLMLLVKRTT